MYSRKESIMELYHNQLTKVQGIFSLRNGYDSYGIHVIANNLGIPCTVLDFPTQKRFLQEIKKGYDYIGISSIIHNFQKVKWMTEQIRKISPRSKIILGGFCATLPNLHKVLDVDYVCIGDGISFMRELLGMPPDYEFRNPDVGTSFYETLGLPLFGQLRFAQVIVGLGCSYGCDFCSPSHFFGRRHIRFYKDGKTLFDEIVRVSGNYKINFISLLGDDNFLIDLQRAEELRQCMLKSGRMFNLMIFGSADKVMDFGVEKLAEMGVHTIWIGRESGVADYPKNRKIDMKKLIEELRRFGIKTILSSILLLDQHTKENIKRDIDEHLACKPMTSQFSHYAPVPGTPLWDRMGKEGRLIPGIPWEDMHAFHEPWYYHPHFTVQEGRDIQEEAYQRDFHELGPTLLRYIEADYEGWTYLRQSDKPHLRARADFITQQMRIYKVMLAAMEHLVPTAHMRELVRDVRQKVEGSFGTTSLFLETLAGIFILTGRLREFRNRHWGDVIQPPTKVIIYNDTRSR